ncbi:hypothetical protein BD324DRAFT_639192 [Kockovaella imperatae]|uniref:DUF1688-domain-containing protein n=1 Tax=Kockovaella imperatae TaxID=4999 RepID=A0A1Y1U865_9TREE|nr:hypothetical protein BD324DRAFT_639192 [Kockovaella imperatae]ORX33697.1 hypothetical protein BD324DRAFT_639192 [Kockovaella imperatae]
MAEAIPDIVTYLRSLDAVHDRCNQVFALAEVGQVDHWTFHQDKVADVVDYCVTLITRDYGDLSKVPPTSRRTHFEPPTKAQDARMGRIPALLLLCPKDPIAKTLTLIDLYVVSVLLDAGAGPDWVYTEVGPDGRETWKGGRSEGLAVASYQMFTAGVFSSNNANKLQVDAKALKGLRVETLAKHLQVSDSNPMAGLEGRCELLIKLGSALGDRPDICPSGRPGEIINYLEGRLPSADTLPLSLLWSTLFELLLPIWPSRTTLPDHPSFPLGDVWPCPSLERSLTGDRTTGDNLVAFHKLTQWLCYSLVEVIESEGGWKVDRGRGQTALPEYRNGGLLVDLGALTIKPETLPPDAYPRGRDQPPLLAPSHPAIVEWRALTIGVLNHCHPLICEKLGTQLSLAQVIEAATWKGGREIAKTKRQGGGPPIDIISDGTVF